MMAGAYWGDEWEGGRVKERELRGAEMQMCICRQHNEATSV
jgi:hypothetical protein